MNFFQSLFSVKRYKNVYDRQRANLVYGILILFLLFFTPYMLLIPGNWGDRGGITLWQYAQTDALGVISLITFYGGAILTYFALRQGYLTLADWGPLVMWFVPTILTTILSPNLYFDAALNFAGLTVFIIIAGVLIQEAGTIVITLFSVVILILVSLDRFTQATITSALILIGIGALMIMFNRLLRANRDEGEILVAEERLKLAQINTLITRRASQRVSVQEVLDLAVNTIIERYESIYHAQIFLINDDGVQAELIASTGEAGRILLDRHHSLAVGSLSVIGQTTLKGQPGVEYAGVNTTHRYNEILPDTVVEAAFPLRVGAEIIGALDLQSKNRNAFNDDDIAQFQSLADSLSLVIDNVRQFEASQKQVQENQRLAEQARNALEEVKRLNKRLIGRAWSEYLGTQTRAGGLNVDFEANTIEEDGRWTATLAQAAQADDFVQSGHIVAVPLRVRGQVIGAMEFELGNDGTLSAEDRELITEISERFGLAAENSRLVEESQRSARREALINQISARLQANNTIEATLTEAARSLSETLQAGRIAIRLGSPDSPPPPRLTPQNGQANGQHHGRKAQS